MTTPQRVKEIVSRRLQIETPELDITAQLGTELLASPEDLVAVAGEIDKYFGTDVTDGIDIDTTVEDLISAVSKRNSVGA